MESKPEFILPPGRRRILGKMEILDEKGETVFSFSKPVLTLNRTGTLIIRKEGIETIEQISADNPTYVVPDELLMHAGILHLLLISGDGRLTW